MGVEFGHALIVEDDLMLGRVFNDMVSDMGFAVTTTDNADEARRALSQHDYAFVVTDLNLHGDREGGLTLANEISRRGSTARIVIVSGHPQPTALGPEISFLQKPFTVAQLECALNRLH